MKGLLSIFLFLLVFGSVYSQRLYKISVLVNGKEKELSYIVNHDLDYISAKEYGNLLGAKERYNPETAKLDLTFDSTSIKITARNQFILINENGIQKVIQIPLSTILFKDDIYLPAVYVIDAFSKTSGAKTEYDDRSKNLKIDYAGEVKVAGAENKIVKNNAAVPVNSKGYDIYDISVEEKTNGTMVLLKTNKNIRVPRYSINNGILYIFLSSSNIAPGVVAKIKPEGLVKKIQQSILSSRNTQLEISLNDGYSSAEIFKDPQTNDLIISIHNKLLSSYSGEAKSKWNFDCVVIDAGHGGKDPGTIGVTGIKEKDVNLGIALKLGKIINKELPDVKVVYTRSTDEFIELYKRGKIANEAGGKLFISVHCNSTESKDNGYRGFEVYLLRPGRTKEAIRIAEFENSVIKYEENQNKYDKLTDENFILVSMAHSQYMRYSESFSDMLNQTWKENVQIPTLGIKQAGFYVLVGASMPGVLIETGFLSNRKDESYLASKAGQNTIAETIFASIKKYKEYYDKQITN